MIENTKTGEIAYAGATFAETEHFWLDGMLEVFADSWDIEQHKIVSQQVGYYGADSRNMYDCAWKIFPEFNSIPAFSYDPVSCLIIIRKEYSLKYMEFHAHFIDILSMGTGSEDQKDTFAHHSRDRQ